MSKHHAVTDDSQADESSWIRDLARPAGEEPAGPQPFYSSLSAGAPQHAHNAEPGVSPATEAPAEPVRRLSAEQVDDVIGRLGVPAVAGASAEPAAPVGPAAPAAPVGLADLVGPEATSAPDALPTDAPGTTVPTDGARGTVATDEAPAVDHATTGMATESEPEVETAQPSTSGSIRGRLRKPLLICAAAALCVLTIGGGSWGALHKTVSIVVDGHAREVSTLSGSVAGALAAAGIPISSHDTLTPAAAAAISDGSTIVLDHARQITVTVDGQQRQVWTTARTADEAQAQLGAGPGKLPLTANRSRAIPLDRPAVTTPVVHIVRLSVAGVPAVSTVTSAETVGQFLAERKVTVGAGDRVRPAPSTRLSDGLAVTVDRVAVSTGSQTIAIPPPAGRTVQDATLAKGTSKVVQAAQPGRAVITFSVTTVNGKQASKVVTSRRTTALPVGRITSVGTKVIPPKSTFTYSGSEVFTNDRSFGVNWDGLAMCESTHNPKAINANPSAGLPTYGLFQFDLPTWESVGGSGNPIDASPQEQLMRAKLLFQQRGLEPWACRDAAS